MIEMAIDYSSEIDNWRPRLMVFMSLSLIEKNHQPQLAKHVSETEIEKNGILFYSMVLVMLSPCLLRGVLVE